MNIEKLPRSPMRCEDEPGYEKEVWQPNWNCFCCHDTGIVNPHLASLVIDGYDSKRDQLPRCINPGCKAGEHWDSETLTQCVDYRISAAICQKLDASHREHWRQAAREKQINIQALAQQMSFRKRDRTSGEEMEAQRRHEEASNTDPEKLREMARAYLSDEFMRDGAS
jgi:hypothetical protein